MKLSDVYEIANRLAPKALSDEMCQKYGHYDNSGILVDVNEGIRAIVFSLDLSEAAIDLAIAKGANLILTHHPAIYGKISRVDYHDEGLLGKKLVRCIKNGISVLSMHLNLDSVEGGIDDCLMEGVLRSAGETEGVGARPIKTQLPLCGGGYGKAYTLPAVRAKALVEGIKRTFHSERVELYGDGERTLNGAASFCGAGADEGAIFFAAAQGVDVMISSDFKHHLLALATELGLSVITLTHYASENYGFKKYYEKIGRQVEIPCYFHEDEHLL